MFRVSGFMLFIAVFMFFWAFGIAVAMADRLLWDTSCDYDYHD